MILDMESGLASNRPNRKNRPFGTGSNYGHGTRALTPYELKVPFVFYLNDGFLAKHPETAKRLRDRRELPVCRDHISHTFMGLAGISDPFVYRSEFDLTSPAFKPGPRQVTDENMRLSDYASIDFSRKSKFKEIKQFLAEEYRSKFTW